MLDTPLASSGNILLAKMAKSDVDLTPLVERVDLKIGEKLYEIHKPVEHVFFLSSGICSIVAQNGEGARIETGLIGREGFWAYRPSILRKRPLLRRSSRWRAAPCG